ncbi:MAG: hypothetical protein ACOCUV_04020 [bacterium]
MASDDNITFYGLDDPPIIDFIETSCVSTNRHIISIYGRPIADFREMLNLQYKYAKGSTHFIPALGMHRSTEILIHTMHGNFFHFWTILHLIEMGVLSEALIIMRTVYEGLLFGKFCALSDDSSLYNQWQNGNYVSVTKSILSKISNIDTTPLKRFWKALCSTTHYSPFSGDYTVSKEYVDSNISLNFALINMLINCNWHFVTQHCISYKLRQYLKNLDFDDDWQNTKKSYDQLAKRMSFCYTKGGKEVVRQFCRKWEVNKSNM